VQLTAAHCREQQVIQLALANSEPLERRKKIALIAAAAWGKEAVDAGKREGRKLALDKLDASIAQEFADEDTAQRLEQI
jgi:hypothetical protein